VSNIRNEKMRLGDLIVDWTINPRDKNDKTIEEFAEMMEDYESKALTFDESWKQPIEITEDKIVTQGSHSLLAAKQIYGDHHEITVRVHVGVTGTEKAAFLSATSNVHGKPYKQGERKKAVFAVFDQTQNLKGGGVKGKQPFRSIREIAAMTGISKGYVYELRADYRAENGLPNESGDVLTPEELADKREGQRNKSQNKTVESVEEKPAVPAEESINLSDFSQDELQEKLDNMTQEEIEIFARKVNTNTPGTTTQPEPSQPQASQPAKPSSEEPEEEEEEPEVYASDEDYDIEDSDYLSGVEKDGYVEKDIKPITPKQKGIKATVIGDTDVITQTPEEIQKEMIAERRKSLKSIEELMNDFIKIERIEAKDSIEIYRNEFEVTRDSEDLWEEPFDAEINGRDTIGSILLTILDLLEEEYDKYSETD